MMVTEQDMMVRREYYKDQMREAEKDRMAREALAGRERGHRLYCKVLAWLGRRLYAWGSSLQKHYGTAVSPSLPRSASPEMGNTTA
jgi:hypothetical protein